MTRYLLCKVRVCSVVLCLVLSATFAPLPRATAQRSRAPETITAADRATFERLARRIEPDLLGKPERLPIYLDFFRREMINDARLVAIDVQANAGDNRRIQLTGFVEFEENRDDLIGFFRALGFDPIEDQIELLPSKDLGELRFGFIAATHSLSFGEPAGKEVVTDCLLGEPVFLLKEAEAGFFLCHSVEGYLGYVDGRDIHRVDADAFLRYQSGRRVTVRLDHTTPAGLLLPVGARLKLLRQDGDEMVVALPAGDEARLPANQCEIAEDRPSPRVERVIENGHRLLGTRYLWGGKSSAGIDCSGLVQVSFAAEGIHFPRDSNQQVYVGRLTATRWYREGMRRGDTLYFLGRHGKIIHTAIYLGDGKYLESAGPGVRITSFHPADANYDARRSRRFAFAKRLLE